jgi:hypothetical protein
MQSIDLPLTVDRPISEAQPQVLALVDHLLGTGYTSRRGENTVEYRPSIDLLLVWTIRRLLGERLTLTFNEQGSATQIRVNGRLRNRPHTKLTESLGAS